MLETAQLALDGARVEDAASECMCVCCQVWRTCVHVGMRLVWTQMGDVRVWRLISSH